MNEQADRCNFKEDIERKFQVKMNLRYSTLDVNNSERNIACLLQRRRIADENLGATDPRRLS